MKFDAWRVEGRWTPDYTELRRRFRLKRFDFFDGEPENFVKNRLVIGHEFFEEWLRNAERGAAALVSGFTPSGIPHLGTLCIFRQMAYYQKKYGAEVYIPIADLESMYARHTKPLAMEANTIDLLAHLAASGVNLERSTIYLQSDNAQTLRKAFGLASLVNKSELTSIYGMDLGLPYALSALLTVSDILLPLDHGSRSVLVTLGIDEIGHTKLAGELARKLGVRNFPAVTYTDLIPGLTLSKMSKSQGRNSIALSESPRAARRKVRNAVADGNELLYDSLTRWFSDLAGKATGATKPERAGEIVRMLLERQNLGYVAAIKDATRIADKLFKNRLK